MTDHTLNRKFEIEKKLEINKSNVAEKKEKILLAKYFGLGYYILTPLLLGVFCGVVADKVFKTAPVLTLIFIILGAVSTFYNLFKLTREN